MSKKKHPSKANRIIKDLSDDFAKKEIEAFGRYYTRNRDMHTVGPGNLNLCVCIRDSITMTGMMWWLYSLGYMVTINMCNIYEQCRLNHFLVLSSNLASVGGIGPSGRWCPSDEEILKEIDDWVSKVKDDEFYKDIINCGTNHKLFKVLAKWNTEDDSTKLYVENYDELQPRKMRYGGNWKNYDAECPEHFKAKMRPATIQEVFDYFNGVGEWDYCETFREEKYRFIDTI